LPATVPGIHYYDVKRHWTTKIEPHLDNPDVKKILVHDFHRFTYGRWSEPFLPTSYPSDFESMDWRHSHKGRRPRYWKYVCALACHWLANFALTLAHLAVPNRQWRIVTSEQHSSVWDGINTLFDFNYLAFGFPPEEAWDALQDGGHQLPPGAFLKVSYAEHYTVARGAAKAVDDLGELREEP
jgi:hypothetical protein